MRRYIMLELELEEDVTAGQFRQAFTRMDQYTDALQHLPGVVSATVGADGQSVFDWTGFEPEDGLDEGYYGDWEGED